MNHKLCFRKDADESNQSLLIRLIIYMEKLLSSDWLRYMQFSDNSVQKRVNSVQKKVNSVQRKKQIRHSDWSIIKETHR